MIFIGYPARHQKRKLEDQPLTQDHREDAKINLETHKCIKPKISSTEKDTSQFNRAAGLASYNLPGQSNYDRSSQGVYGSSYGVGNRSPVSLSKNYAYPSDDLGSSLRGSGSYSASANYSNYHFGSGAPPPAY
eukprot:Gb_40915 [translate_table: standard]